LVKSYFAELYYDQMAARRLEAVPKVETLHGGAYKDQQPVVVRVADQLR
jgi:hypothetical protein